jgi:hypothetical protein
MAKSKKNTKTSTKRSVRVQDLQPNKNPKGGAMFKNQLSTSATIKLHK